MHRNVLETLFNPQHSTRQQQHKDAANNNNTVSRSDDTISSRSSAAAADPHHQEQQEEQDKEDPTAAAIAAVWSACLSPARLFAGLYAPNLLANGSFLERLNCHKGPQRRLVWVSVYVAGLS